MIVDVQRDFLPCGALPVPRSDEIVPVLNRWIATARNCGAPVYATRDWHPSHHVSFESRGGPWPAHCIQNTPGADFAPGLDLADDVRILSKGADPDLEQYSPFDNTDLAETLAGEGIRRLWIGGLALDVCVRATVLDALQAGFEVRVVRAATRAITPEAGEQALDDIRAAGAAIEREEDEHHA